jgi:hypothetical protein
MSPKGRPAVARDGPDICKELRFQDTRDSPNYLPPAGDDRSGRFAGSILLEGEDVVQHPLDAPPLQPVVGDEAGVAEQLPKLEAERSIDAQLASLERLLEEYQALVQDLEALPPIEHLVHRLKTETLPPSTLTLN